MRKTFFFTFTTSSIRHNKDKKELLTREGGGQTPRAGESNKTKGKTIYLLLNDEVYINQHKDD